jgi:hypothetical protein
MTEQTNADGIEQIEDRIVTCIDHDPVQDRIERARTRDLEVTIESAQPLVASVYSAHSDSMHTVVPQALHCSCEDNTYRGPLCYHLIAILLQEVDGESDAIDAVHAHARDALSDRMTEIQDEYVDLISEVSELLQERWLLQDVRDEMPSGWDVSALYPTVGEDVQEHSVSDTEQVLQDYEVDAEALADELADTDVNRGQDQENDAMDDVDHGGDDVSEMVSELHR